MNKLEIGIFYKNDGLPSQGSLFEQLGRQIEKIAGEGGYPEQLGKSVKAAVEEGRLPIDIDELTRGIYAFKAKIRPFSNEVPTEPIT